MTPTTSASPTTVQNIINEGEAIIGSPVVEDLLTPAKTAVKTAVAASPVGEIAAESIPILESAFTLFGSIDPQASGTVAQAKSFLADLANWL
jgi:hypothetical protein